MTGRASGVKMVGMMEVGTPTDWMVWRPSKNFGASACIIFHLHHKTQKMACNSKNVGHHPVGAPDMPTETGGGETQPERVVEIMIDVSG